MKTKLLFYLLTIFSIAAFGCSKAAGSMEMGKNENSEFENMCTDAGYRELR